MKNRNRKIFAGSMAAVLLLGAGSLAWFTDRTEGSVTGQAGNLCIELSDIKADLDHLAPGDNEEITFEYKNLGSLAMDTRITYALSYELNEDVEDVIENDLDKVATLTVGDEELVLTADNDKVTGTFETGILNGTKEFSGEDLLSEALNFHFDESVGNIGQLMTFKLDVLVEGKQNRNNPTWEQVHKTEITFGGEEVKVVPKSACNVSTESASLKLIFDDVRYIVASYTELDSGYDTTIEAVIYDEEDREVARTVIDGDELNNIVVKLDSNFTEALMNADESNKFAITAEFNNGGDQECSCYETWVTQEIDIEEAKAIYENDEDIVVEFENNSVLCNADCSFEE